MTTTKFSNPPISEVSLSVRFEKLLGFKVQHFGAFWESFKTEWPTLDQAPPIATAVTIGELVDDELGFPLPRCWFVSKDGNMLRQLQQNMLVLNWKKGGDEYPTFEKLLPEFMTFAESFEKFITRHGIGTAKPIEYKMTYINEIDADEQLDEARKISNVFPDFDWKHDNCAFLRSPASSFHRHVFNVNDDGTKLITKISCRPHQDNKTSRFEISVKNETEDLEKNFSTMDKWFVQYHEIINQTFKGMINKTVQEKLFGLQENRDA